MDIRILIFCEEMTYIFRWILHAALGSRGENEVAAIYQLTSFRADIASVKVVACLDCRFKRGLVPATHAHLLSYKLWI
jgi:hypothetical protein